MITKVHQITNYYPYTPINVKMTMFQGPQIVRQETSENCQFETDNKGKESIKTNPSIVPDKRNKAIGKYVRVGEEVEWLQNFTNIVRDDPKNADLVMVFEIYETYPDGNDEEMDPAWALDPNV